MFFVAGAGFHERFIARQRCWLTAVLQVLGLSVLFLGLAAGLSFIRFGSIRAGQAWVNGNELYVGNPRIEGYYELKDESKSMSFEIRNISSVPVSILGFRNSCTCTLIESIPNVIAPKGTVALNILVRIDPARSGTKIVGSIWLYANESKRSEIVFQYVLWPASPKIIIDQEKKPASFGSLTLTERSHRDFNSVVNDLCSSH